MNERKRFRLQKDLPNIATGAVLTESRSGSGYTTKDVGGVDVTLTKKLVENNQDWFLPLSPLLKTVKVMQATENLLIVQLSGKPTTTFINKVISAIKEISKEGE